MNRFRQRPLRDQCSSVSTRSDVRLTERAQIVKEGRSRYAECEHFIRICTSTYGGHGPRQQQPYGSPDLSLRKKEGSVLQGCLSLHCVCTPYSAALLYSLSMGSSGTGAVAMPPPGISGPRIEPGSSYWQVDFTPSQFHC